MDDAIYRQDAIDLVKHRMKHNPRKSVEFIQGLQDAYLRVISDLNRIPPAQPEVLAHGEGEITERQEASVWKWEEAFQKIRTKHYEIKEERPSISKSARLSLITWVLDVLTEARGGEKE